MRFIKVLLIAMLVWAPVMANSVAHAGEGRTVAAEKSKKGKKAKKAGKAKKGKKEAKAKGKKASKAKKAAKKGKAAKKAKKVAVAKKPKSHAPAEHLMNDTAADPAENFEISPEMQDDLPAPNNGDLTD